MKVNIGFPDNQFDSPLCHTKLAGWTWDSHSSVETLLAPFTSQGLYSDEPERIPSRTVLPGATEEEVIGSTLTLQPPNCARTGHGHPQDGCLVPWAGAWPEYSPCCPNGQWSGPGVHSQENSSSEEVFFFNFCFLAFQPVPGLLARCNHLDEHMASIHEPMDKAEWPMNKAEWPI